MKKIVLSILITSSLIGCNSNPNKEARIQKLESEVETMNETLVNINHQLKVLEVENEKLTTRIFVLEKK